MGVMCLPSHTHPDPQAWGTIKLSGQLGQMVSLNPSLAQPGHCLNRSLRFPEFSPSLPLSTLFSSRDHFPKGQNIPAAARQGEHFLPEPLGLPLKAAPPSSATPWSEAKGNQWGPSHAHRPPLPPPPPPPPPRVKASFPLLSMYYVPHAFTRLVTCRTQNSSTSVLGGTTLLWRKYYYSHIVK